MRLSLVLMVGLLTSSLLVGCQSCPHCNQGCDDGFVADNGVVYKPVKPSPFSKLGKKKCKHKHDNCPMCSSGDSVQGAWGNVSSDCSGCGAPSAMGPVGCSSCGMPSQFSQPQMASNCGSCGGGVLQMSMPTSNCSSCGHNHGASPMPDNVAPSGPFFQGEVIPGLTPMNPHPAPAPTPAPPAEDRKAEPLPMGTSLIPILPSPGAPRHVQWVPTPVK